jgi:integrase/recombinase XerD
MVLRIKQGQGREDRYALLPPLPLERLRTWRAARVEGKILLGGWLFPGLSTVDPHSTGQLFGLRATPDRLQFLPQPALPQV